MVKEGAGALLIISMTKTTVCLRLIKHRTEEKHIHKAKRAAKREIVMAHLFGNLLSFYKHAQILTTA